MEFQVDQLRSARHVVVFSGAGISAESGIPTFRDALTGLWENFDPAALATAQAFRNDPTLVWGWYEWRRAKVLAAQPNAAHLAIAELARRVPMLTVVTQNVDDLLERAGCCDVLHLHGSLSSPRCFAYARPYTFSADPLDEPPGGRRIEPPRCLHCNGKVRGARPCRQRRTVMCYFRSARPVWCSRRPRSRGLPCNMARRCCTSMCSLSL